MEAYATGRLARCFVVGLAALCFAAFAGACSGEQTAAPIADNLEQEAAMGQAEPPPADGAFRVYEEWPFDAEEARRRQEETAEALGVPVEKEVDLGGEVGMVLVLIPAGEFLMGSPDSEQGGKHDEGPLHLVRIGQPFYMGKYPVTQAQWEQVMGSNPSHFQGDARRPVENVSWKDCQPFLQRLNAIGQGTFRLPTEAEWEYACRAGTTTRFNTGDSDEDLEAAGWYQGNSSEQTHPVGQKQMNAWNLYDMHGNVWEWTQTLYKDFPFSATDGRESLTAAGSRVERGGSWFDHPRGCRSAARNRLDPRIPSISVGFRVVLSAQK